MDEKTESQIQLRFVTKEEKYAVSDSPYVVERNVSRTELSWLVNAILRENNASGVTAIEFDFLVCGELLRSSLGEHLVEKGLSTEDTIELEYFECLPPPTPKDCLMHDDWVSAVHANPNWILSGSYDNSVHIWTTKGRHKLTVPGHTSPVKAVSWVSAQGDHAIFISCSHDQSAILWDWNVSSNTAECLFTCRGHDEGLECVAVSADTEKFVTGGWDTNICLWSTSLDDVDHVPDKKKNKSEYGNSKVQKPLSTFKGHKEAVSGVKWMDFNTVLSSGWDHLLKIWDCELGAIKQEIAGNKAFFDIDWSPLNNSVITASADRHVRLYDPRSTESIVKATYTSHSNWVQSVRWSKTQDVCFMSGGYDSKVKLWDTRSPRTPLYDLSGHEDKVLCCDWSNASLLISGACDNTLRVFKLRDNKDTQRSM